MDNTFLQNKKLLLVDDEPELLEMVTAILSDEGFGNIVTAVSVKEGISAVQNEKPDLAILDVMLPESPLPLKKGLRPSLRSRGSRKKALSRRRRRSAASAGI